MSAVHRVDDIYAMPAARFFRLAWRLPHYQGAMRDCVLAMQQAQEHGDAPQQPAAAPPARHRPATAPARSQPVGRDILADPVMGKIFDFG